MPERTINGRRLGFEIQPESFDKNGLTVVFIHGTGGDREHWRDQLNGLSSTASMLALELPGHGTSEGPGEATVQGFSRWVIDFIDAVDLRKVMLVGCSLGSAITQWIALNARQPWLVALGLVGAGARLKVHPAFLEGLRDNKNKALSMLADFCLSDSPDPVLHAKLREKFLDADAELILGDLGACNEFDVMGRLSEIDLPTCIIVGQEDKLTPVKYAKFLSESIKNSSLQIIPAAGHLVSMEQPLKFNEILSDFIRRL
ncbi:alpha/beta fold hydrolase [Desulfomonile tiedjei]|uniref:Putative hydrolase or acyltransferase of alpha/beta superfamily n=1 Tax=Desulfomonile tiedjei (strain ATCC 49306 / DSM 6799 / DCB-1) TaxID=706587 RepID=I4C469_DESTA|nr:alpha/beta fold hydrolase [Desulfomonile tiedjei]AFM24360.1 putative hydrolase or acyltransferase of alpha/beta superfamily [Desulfomonile tiedjei DSM 6799]